MGFQMLTEKFDACLGTSGSPLFVSGLHCEPFCILPQNGSKLLYARMDGEFKVL